MALAAFLMVIFEHLKQDTIKAGINYLIQSHISIAGPLGGLHLGGVPDGLLRF